MGCLKRAVGCIGAVIGLFVLAFVGMAFFAGSQAKGIRNQLTPGLTVEQVVERADGWLSCHAYAGPPEKRVVDFEVRGARYGVPFSETQHAFQSRAAMVSALRKEMEGLGIPWKMTFGYITITPRRIYFDVEFSSDGKVTKVSETRWSVLD